MSCKYCRNEVNPYNSYYKTGFVIRYNSLFVYRNIGGGMSEILLEKDIKYCPFCGSEVQNQPQITLGKKMDLWNKNEEQG